MAASKVLLGPIDCPVEDVSFFRWAKDITATVGPDWRHGVLWEPTTCVDSHPLDCEPCCDVQPGGVVGVPGDGGTVEEDTPLQFEEIPELCCASPFSYYVGLSTHLEEGVLIKTLPELAEMARAALAQHDGHRMSRALVTNYLAPIATDITGGTESLSFARGLGLLLRNRVCGTWFTVPETAVPYLIQEGLSDGDSLLGHPMIVVPTNTAPSQNAGATGFWIYAHSPVEYVMGEPYIVQGESHNENIRVSFARREALIRTDACRTYAVSAIDPGC